MKKQCYLSKKNISKFATRVRSSKGLDTLNQDAVARLGFTMDRLPEDILSVEFDSMGSHYHGLGLRNVNGGIQFYGSIYRHPLITLGTPGVIHVKGGGEDGTSCLLFATIADYLRCLNEHYDDMGFSEADVVVINEWSNFYHAVKVCSSYDDIGCCLPGTTAGNMMFLTLKDVASGNCAVVGGFPEERNDVRQKLHGLFASDTSMLTIA